MKTLTRETLNKDIKRYVGPHTKLKFKNDNNWYWFKNFSTDFNSIFLTLPGVGIKNKKVKDLVEVWNGQLFKIEDIVMEEENIDKEKQLEKGIEIEKEHLPTYNKLKEYYKEFNKLPSKEEFFEWIAKDHINEFSEDDYYKALEQMEEELKNNVITEEVTLSQIEETTEEGVPEFTDREKKEEVIESRQTIENIIGEIEAALLDEQNTLIPPKINYIMRLNTVLTALKSLRDDLAIYSKIVQENKDIRFSKKDVELIVESNYKVINKQENLYTISARNIFRENKDTLCSYNMEVFYDENCLSITPLLINEASKKTADRILYEIYEDLETIKSNSEIVSENIEPEIEFDEYTLEANEYIKQVVEQYFFDKNNNLEFLDKEIEEISSEKENDYVKAESEIYLSTKPIGKYDFSEISFILDYSFFNKLNSEQGDELKPSFVSFKKEKEKISLNKVFVNGSVVELTDEVKSLINSINWLKYF